MKMQYSDWEPIYNQILEDMGYDKGMDETSVRILKMVTVNCDLMDEEELTKIIGTEVTIFGNSDNLEKDIENLKPIGTFIASGSAVSKLLRMKIIPDIIVTDLDGDIVPQIQASEDGTISLLHAHGDNHTAILMYASRFKGPVILTTQSKPDTIVLNFGGFTDGDRAVCLAKHYGAKKILLEGFDFDNPGQKINCDPEKKLKKLKWAKKIIYDYNKTDVEIIKP